jgi:hypothetical protein
LNVKVSRCRLDKKCVHQNRTSRINKKNTFKRVFDSISQLSDGNPNLHLSRSSTHNKAPRLQHLGLQGRIICDLLRRGPDVLRYWREKRLASFFKGPIAQPLTDYQTEGRFSKKVGVHARDPGAKQDTLRRRKLSSAGVEHVCESARSQLPASALLFRRQIVIFLGWPFF